MQSWLETSFFEFGEFQFNGKSLLIAICISLLLLGIYSFANRWLQNYAQKHDLAKDALRSIDRLLIINFLLSWVILLVIGLEIDVSFDSFGNLSISNLLSLLLIMLVAKMADIFISARIMEEMTLRSEQEILRGQYGSKDQKSSITRIIQYSLITIVFIVMLPFLGIDFTLHTVHFENSDFALKITNVLTAVLVILIARILVWLFVNIILYGWYQNQRIDLGKQYAYNQLLTYVIYTFAFILALQYMGFKLTLLYAGAAALLVGVGIALQQTISDFFSGLIILFERSVEAGDFLDLGDEKGTVKKIGLRASIIETLERKDIIIPNSKLVNENVVNWTKSKPTTRFEVLVGVAYGSDLTLVKQLLLQSAMSVNGVLLAPKPFVRFLDFGDSSLNFGLYFYSMNVTYIEDLKSDLRFNIDSLFRKNGIEIPFPQRVIWTGDKEDKQ